MYRLVQLTVLAALVATVLSRPGDGAPLSCAQDGDDPWEEVEGEAWVTSCGEVTGVCVHAAERRDGGAKWRLRTAPAPHVVCLWYPGGTDPGGWDDPDGPVPVVVLLVGSMYTVDCHRVVDGSRVTGYPRPAVHRRDGEDVPGERSRGWDVAEYAVGRLGLEAPEPVVAPPTVQIVGIETWFAVTSKLRGYPDRSAQAGSVWATVSAYFAEATWNFGSRGRLTCIAHAARTWDPSLSGDRQSSACTKVFDTESGPGGLDATVTVRWRIYWRSSEHSGWRRHDDFTLTTMVPLDVRQIQAVIR